jgi:putative ABC transport system permease protein
MILQTFGQDLRIGLRMLVKEKSFCALAVIVLALGIGGVTTMFSVVNGVMLRGFSFPNAARLESINFIDPTSRTSFGVNGLVSSMDYEEVKTQQKSFEMLATYIDGSTVNVTIDGNARRYTGAYTTEDFLRILGVSPLMGRDFTAADNVPGAPSVALIGYGMWQRDFGGEKDILGKGVRINGRPATVIGVMPQGFAFPTNEELWSPLYTEFPPKPRGDPSAVNPGLIGLLKRDVSIDQANAEFTTFARHLAEAYPATNKQFNTGQVQPLIIRFTGGPLRGTLWTMLAFCVGVLLIACVNVMNMQFARATLRGKELAIRSSLGAGRSRLIRQMLTESLLVAGIGTGAGIALAYGATNWLTSAVRNLDNPPPSWITFDVDGSALAISVAAMLVAAVASGLLPAWISSRADTNDVLREGGRHTNRRASRISRALVVFQIAVACVLLIGAILQVRSIVKQQQIDYGYDTEGILSARMGLMDGAYPSGNARKEFYDRLLLQLKDDPDFAASAFTNRLRMAFSGSSPIEIDGQQDRYKKKGDRPLANNEQVTPGYFDVTGQKLLDGRPFTADDIDSRLPVAIVNARFAEKFYGHENPIGRRFRTAAADGSRTGPWRTIVGVVSTVRMLGPFNNPNVDESGFYVPFYVNATAPDPPAPFFGQFATVLVKPRPGQRVDSLVNLLRKQIQKADPDLPLYFVGTPKSQIDTYVAPNRILATMFTMFGAVAMVLASVGIYGVTSFSVNQRTQEFGVRMALGADGGRILAMVLRQGVGQAAVGLIAGIALALAIATAMGTAIQNTLFGVSGRDPLTYLTVSTLVVIVWFSATLFPARRATRVHPVTALRSV